MSLHGPRTEMKFTIKRKDFQVCFLKRHLSCWLCCAVPCQAIWPVSLVLPDPRVDPVPRQCPNSLRKNDDTGRSSSLPASHCLLPSCSAPLGAAETRPRAGPGRETRTCPTSDRPRPPAVIDMSRASQGFGLEANDPHPDSPFRLRAETIDRHRSTLLRDEAANGSHPTSHRRPPARRGK
jgi:hypothetical protein